MSGIGKYREVLRVFGWLSIALWMAWMGMANEAVAQTQKIEIENRTGIPVKIEVRSSKYSGAEVDRFVEELEIPLAGIGKAKIPARNGKLEWVRLDMLTEFGRTHLIWSPKGNATRFLILAEHVPIVERQTSWYPWQDDKGHKCEAKLIGIVSKGDVRKAALLKANGEIKYIATNRLSKADQLVLRGVEKGAHKWSWYIGGPLIGIQQLKGEVVTMVLKKRTKEETIYGPVLKGKIVDVIDERLVFEGEGEQHVIGIKGKSVKSYSLKPTPISLVGSVIGENQTHLLGIALLDKVGVDSILIGDSMYVPKGKASLKRVETTSFWSAFAEGKTDMFYSKSQLKSASDARLIVGGAATMGAILWALKGLDSGTGSGGRVDSCVIEGKVAPRTKVFYGSGIGTYNSTVSDSYGNYRFSLLLRPVQSHEYYLDIEVGGKRVRKWTGKLDGYGRNVIDLR